MDEGIRDAEDVFVITELPVTRDIDELMFELFVGIREVAYELFICGGSEVMVASVSTRYKSVTVFNILKAKFQQVMVI